MDGKSQLNELPGGYRCNSGQASSLCQHWTSPERPSRTLPRPWGITLSASASSSHGLCGALSTPSRWRRIRAFEELFQLQSASLSFNTLDVFRAFCPLHPIAISRGTINVTTLITSAL